VSRIKNGFNKGFNNQRFEYFLQSTDTEYQSTTTTTHQQMIVAVGNSRDVILQGPSPAKKKKTDARSISFSLGPLPGCCVSCVLHETRYCE
jgi:hypothetical protein